MSETMEGDRVAFDRRGVTLTRLEATTALGGVLVIVSLLLPWASTFDRSVSGLEYTWAWPGFVVAAAVVIVLSLPEAHPRVRNVVVTLVGVVLASLGIILLLGMRMGLTAGIGLLLFTLAGGLVTGGGYVTLVRDLSAIRATAVLCVVSLVVLVVGLLAINAS